MAKIASNVHKRANNLAVRGEIGMRLSATNIDHQLPNSEYRLIRFQLKVEDGIKLHVRNACVLYVFPNDIGDEKHYPLYKSKTGRNTKNIHS